MPDSCEYTREGLFPAISAVIQRARFRNRNIWKLQRLFIQCNILFRNVYKYCMKYCTVALLWLKGFYRICGIIQGVKSLKIFVSFSVYYVYQRALDIQMTGWFNTQKIAYDFIKTCIVNIGKESMLAVLALACLCCQK